MNVRACISVAVLLNGSLQFECIFHPLFPLFSAFPRCLRIVQLPPSRLDVACLACSVFPAGPSIDTLFPMQPFKLSIISNQQLCADFSGSGYACGLLQEMNKVYSQPKLGFTLLLRMCNNRRLSRARNGTICAIIVCPAQELGGCGGTILRGLPPLVAVIMYQVGYA